MSLLVSAGPPVRAILIGALLLVIVRPAGADFVENFDAAAVPGFPAGWTSDSWSTTTSTPDTAPNCAVTLATAQPSDRNLDSPATRSARRWLVPIRSAFPRAMTGITMSRTSRHFCL